MMNFAPIGTGFIPSLRDLLHKACYTSITGCTDATACKRLVGVTEAARSPLLSGLTSWMWLCHGETGMDYTV